MPSAPHAVASSSSSKRSRPERRPSRAALERNLQILDRLEPLLPPDFPTPSSSRSAAPGSKRSADHLAGNQDTKRQRVGVDSARRYEHSVDGVDDARQQPQHPVHQAIQAPMPIVRPRRRLERSNDIWAKKASEYRELARKLKFSGEAHNAASFAPNSSSYKPLKNPPPPGDPYHQHMSLMARLELIDSLICFAYSHWLSDYSARSCNPIAWRSSGPLTSVVSQLWTTDAVDEREKCFNGLVLLIDGFVNSRIVAYEQARSKSDFAKLDAERNRVYAREKATKEKRVRAERAAAQGPANSLPSPASTSTPGSADSNSPKEKELSAQDFELSRGEWTKQFISIPGPVADEALSLASAAGSARRALTYAPSSLNLRTLMIHFPKTFARVLYSTLQHDDEAEPDMEDKDGELYWPSTPSSGEGIGWVCLLGKAMINEFGGTIGYRGYDGCVPKVAEPKQQEQ